MVKVRWTDKATQNLEDLHSYIAKDSVLYAQRFIKSLIHSTKILEEQPFSGRIVPELTNPDIREIIYRNYRIIYRIQKNTNIEILCVYHGAKDFNNFDVF